MRKVILQVLREQQNTERAVSILMKMFLFFGLLSSQVSFAQQACSHDGNGNTRVLICHTGKNVLCMQGNVALAHLGHGDNYSNANCIKLSCSVTGSGGKITCTKPTVTLMATSETPGVSFSWSGPNGFRSDSANPTASVPGIYTVTASGSPCTTTDTALISADAISLVPPDLTTTSGTITCADLSVTLTANSFTTDVAYKWTGPEGFISISADPIVSVAGIYTVTATDPANGCISADTLVVEQNTVAVGITATGGILTYATPFVSLNASSVTPGVSFAWTGPNDFTSDNANPAVSTPGIYKIVATKLISGCSATASIEVVQDRTTPAVVTASSSLHITHSTPAVQQQNTRPVEARTQFEFNTYPNPVTGKAVITFQSAENASVSVAIYNSNGAQEKALFNQRVESMRLYKQEINTTHLSTGAHYWMIKVNNKLYSKKLIVVR